MKPISCGLAMCKAVGDELHVLLVHPGGPIWVNRDWASWSLPKGVVDEEETEFLATAIREFEEETGFVLSDCEFVPLGCTETRSKVVYAWAFHGDCDVGEIESNMFHMEWPRGSGEEQEFEEVDRGEFFSLAEAHKRISPGQIPLLDIISLDVLLSPIQICKKSP